jgi:RNA polymerase sigma factor (sigma-70 family)
MSSPALRDLEPLVVAASSGDRDAFGQLVGATSGVVSSIALAILGDLETSRDVAQDVFLAAWRDLRKLRNPASFLPWLRQLTRNRAHHVLRTHVRARRHRAEEVTEDFLEAVADPRPDASVRLVAREDAAALAEALAVLPDDTREVLTLFYREGQSVSQVAELLDLTDAAVKKRLSRARESLRDAVLERAADTLRATAPTAAFTAAIVAALSTTAPATASASALVASKGLLEVGLGGKVLVVALAALPGALGGIAGVLLGTRSHLTEARDEEELNGVRRYRVVASLAVLFFALSMPLGEIATGWRYWPAMDFFAFVLALAWMQHVWLPGIIRRRLDAEMREDPVRATARRRRERRNAIIGWSLGLTCGTLGLIAGMWMSAHR